MRYVIELMANLSHPILVVDPGSVKSKKTSEEFYVVDL